MSQAAVVGQPLTADKVRELEERVRAVNSENAQLWQRLAVLETNAQPNLDQPYQTTAEQHLKSYVQNGFAARYMMEHGDLIAQRKAFEQLRWTISQEVNELVRKRWEERGFSMEKIDPEALYQEHAQKKQQAKAEEKQ